MMPPTRARRALAVLALCSLAISAYGQDSDCAESIAAAVAPLKAQLEEATTARAAIEQEVTGQKDSYTKLYAAWQQATADVEKLQASSTEAQKTSDALKAETTQLKVSSEALQLELQKKSQEVEALRSSSAQAEVLQAELQAKSRELQDLRTSSAQEHKASESIQLELQRKSKEVDELKSISAQAQKASEALKAALQSKTTELEGLNAKLAALTTKLAAAEEKLSQAPEPVKLDVPTIAVALVGIAKENAVAAADTGKAVFEELKLGKTDLLTKLGKDLVSTVVGAASSTVAFIKTEADEHLPERVKTQIRTNVAKAQALWKEHVTDAAWAQPVLKQLSGVNDELKKVVTSTLSSTPALASLADPVTVQLLVYTIFSLPVLLLLVVPLALLGGKKKPATSDSRPTGGKKKKGKSRA